MVVLTKLEEENDMSTQRPHRMSRVGLAAIGLLAAVFTYSGCSHCGSPWRGEHHTRNYDAHSIESPRGNGMSERTPLSLQPEP